MRVRSVYESAKCRMITQVMPLRLCAFRTQLPAVHVLVSLDMLLAVLKC